MVRTVICRMINSKYDVDKTVFDKMTDAERYEATRTNDMNELIRDIFFLCKLKMSQITPQLVQQLIYFKQSIVPGTSAKAFLNGPNQLMFFRSIVRHCPATHKKLLEIARDTWRDATLILDGSRKYEKSEILLLTRNLLDALVDIKIKTEDPYLHDIVHVICKMFRLLRFALMHPSRSVGSLTFRFPKSESKLDLLIAAEHFFNQVETKEEIALLKKTFSNPPGIAEVTRSSTVYGFQSPGEFYLLTPYNTTVFSKLDDMTLTKLKALVSEMGS